jgi:hypothetical protein
MKRCSMAVSLGLALVVAGPVAVAGATHARPQGASPLRVSLGPAFELCTSANGSHPFAGGSCRPPVQTSDYLTVGSPDANGQPAKSNSFARYAVVAGVPGPPDDSDVDIEIELTDVRNSADLTDYTGELQARSTVRLTDHQNGPPGSLGGTEAGTTLDAEHWVFLPVTIQCVATSDTTVGSTCRTATTANALLPGVVTDGKRVIVQRVTTTEVYDGGADGVASTLPNTLFAREGVFVP